MKQNEYQIKSKNITNYSEETSSISNISYEIENANDNHLNRDAIREQIKDYKIKGEFPSNLEYVDSYTDPNTGTTSTAFLNKDSGFDCNWWKCSSRSCYRYCYYLFQL